MKALKSGIKALPGVSNLAHYLKQRYQPLNGFYTLSPDVLIAIVKAFNIQKEQIGTDKNLIDGYGYYEFGMFKGFSFWFAEQISREYTGSNFRLYGFDSFEGLPKPELDSEAAVFSKGQYHGSYEQITENFKKWGTDFSRMKLYKGFYSDDFFKNLRENEKFPPISICVIDVDLYNSCVPVLDFIKDHLVEGSILLFDDYNQLGEDDKSGERRALLEFERRNPGFKKEHLFNFGWEGVAFRVTSLWTLLLTTAGDWLGDAATMAQSFDFV